ncbi:MAG: carboxypeptidase regulatory-like domain-containing protein [Polyangiaceae bacterium]|nr:carboxypeptidase regulatory-like domain-containing protein [Polyangiaceae bacterium]
MGRYLRGVAPFFASAVAAVFAASAGCSEDPAGASGSGGAGGAGGGGGEMTTTSASSTTGSGTSTGSGVPLPDEFVVTGTVTDGTAPLEGAIVMQGGGEPQLVTGPDGAYSITLTNKIAGAPTVVAAKTGYRARGVEFMELPEGPVELDLIYASAPDNIGYVYGNPGKGTLESDNSTKFCGHCHTTFAAQFQTSAHAKATRDPLVQDLYAGVSRAFLDQASCEAAGGEWKAGLVPGTAGDIVQKCYLGGGVLPDLNVNCGGAGLPSCDDPGLPEALKPTAFGRCADCHAAGIDGKLGGRSLLEATGLAYENGNHCDVCHHIKDIDLTKPPGTGGRLIMQRPKEKLSEGSLTPLQVMFGPLPDVPLVFMGGSYQPKFSTAELCAGCHEQKQEAMLPGASLDAARWPDGLPTHSTFSEWSDGPFNTPGTPCQFCHMPPTYGLKNTVDVANEDTAGIVFGFMRPPEKIRSHIFRSPLEGSPRLIDTAAAVFLGAQVGAGEVLAAVTVKNTGCGHALPTGEPMRSVLLVVRAEACGQAMAPSGGMTLSDVGGAAAEGTVGADVMAAGSDLAWAAGAARAKAGDWVRAVRPTGVFDDYAGIGFFADPGLSPEQKGIEIREPVGEAKVLAAGAGTISLSAALPLQAGDIVFLGDEEAGPPADGDIAKALAGTPGYAFARVMTGPGGERGVPHYKALDIASDNRIAPQAEATSEHRFAIPPGCGTATIAATVLYRPVPLHLARERGWEARDYVIATAKETIALP